MKRRHALTLTAFILATLLFAGCRTSPLYNVKEEPVVVPDSPPTMEQMNQVIRSAGNSLGWLMKSKAPGHTVATLHLRSHVAVVDIHYNTKTYSITYKDSTNLNYDKGADETYIHSNYNGWIQNLDNAIKVRLNNL